MSYSGDGADRGFEVYKEMPSASLRFGLQTQLPTNRVDKSFDTKYSIYHSTFRG